jgi:hypothetical protein
MSMQGMRHNPKCLWRFELSNHVRLSASGIVKEFDILLPPRAGLLRRRIECRIYRSELGHICRMRPAPASPCEYHACLIGHNLQALEIVKESDTTVGVFRHPGAASRGNYKNFF